MYNPVSLDKKRYRQYTYTVGKYQIYLYELQG